MGIEGGNEVHIFIGECAIPSVGEDIVFDSGIDIFGEQCFILYPVHRVISVADHLPVVIKQAEQGVGILPQIGFVHPVFL